VLCIPTGKCKCTGTGQWYINATVTDVHDTLKLFEKLITDDLTDLIAKHQQMFYRATYTVLLMFSRLWKWKKAPPAPPPPPRTQPQNNIFDYNILLLGVIWKPEINST
jgi:hypothetical protein